MFTIGSIKEWAQLPPRHKGMGAAATTRSMSREGENLGGELDEVKSKKRKREDDEPKKRNAKTPADVKSAKKKTKSTHVERKEKAKRKQKESKKKAKAVHNTEKKKGPTKKQLKDGF